MIFVGLIWGDFFHRIFCWQSHKGGLVELLDLFLGLRDFLFNKFSYLVVSENTAFLFNTILVECEYERIPSMFRVTLIFSDVYVH